MTAPGEIANGFLVAVTAADKEITNATVTIWHSVSGLEFSPTVACDEHWSNLTATGTSETHAGIEYFGYKTSFTGSFPTTHPTTAVPFYVFSSECPSTSFNPTEDHFYIYATATYDGTDLIYEGGPFLN